MISFLILDKNTTKGDFTKSSLEEKVNGECDISYLKESDSFKYDLLKSIDELKGDLICITRKDCFAYDKINLKEIEDVMSSEPDLLCFSLILGKNIEICQQMETRNTLHGQEEKGNVMVWDWSKHYLDFGNPFYLDGTVFRKKEFIKMIRSVTFSSSEMLEENLQEVYATYPKNKMASFLRICVVVMDDEKFEKVDQADFSKVNSFIV